jgi:arginyl-tRNA synthetase
MNGVECMIFKQKLSEALKAAVIKAQEQGILAISALPEISVDHPQKKEHGDYASNLPLKLARAAGLSPQVIAAKIIELIPELPEISQMSIAAPGFINFSLNQSWLNKQVEEILKFGDTYGEIDLGGKRSIQLEFVSGNPTGPLHVGHGRGAVLGSALANVLSIAGFNVKREYYINDAGSQLEAFNRSLYARYKQCLGINSEMPSNGYFGSYMIDLAEEILKDNGKRFIELPEETAVSELGKIGIAKVMDLIKNDLSLLGVEFDEWFSEQSLFRSGVYDKVMDLLKKGGYIAEREGATWFTSSALGENKDNVLVRSDGTPTYFASDIAYHYNKFIDRKFEQVIDIWGADHHGHVSRMKAVVGAFGIKPDQLTVLICQLVTLKRGEEIVKVSKRSGDMITLKELIEEVGRDACRFVFLSRSADSQMDFDLELAKKQSADNPVYYVQYAHARISSILKLAQERQIDYSKGDVSLLQSPSERELVKQMFIFPEVVETISKSLEPQHLPYYAIELATIFHSFYKDCRVVSDDECLSAARLKLVKATQIVLARVLHLMGMSAPDSM